MNKFEKAYFAIISQQDENIEADYSLDNLFWDESKFNGEEPDDTDYTYKNYIIPQQITLSNGNKCKIAIKGNIYIGGTVGSPKRQVYEYGHLNPYECGGLEYWTSVGYPFELSFDSIKNDEIILIKITDNNTSFKVKFSELSKADKYSIFNKIKVYFQDEDYSFGYKLDEDLDIDPQYEEPVKITSLTNF